MGAACRRLGSNPGGSDMKRLMVRYKVKADRVAENERYVRQVFEQLERDRPAGLRYASFKLEDGGRLMHMVSLVLWCAVLSGGVSGVKGIGAGRPSLNLDSE